MAYITFCSEQQSAVAIFQGLKRRVIEKCCSSVGAALSSRFGFGKFPRFSPYCVFIVYDSSSQQSPQ